MKKKIIKNNMAPLEMSKNCTRFAAFEQEAFMNYPGKDEWRNRLKYTLLEWVDSEEAETVMDFCAAYKIPRRTFYSWVEKYEDLRFVVDEVKLLLANKDIKAAKRREYDKDVVFKYIHNLDPEWREINKYHADLKKREEANKGSGAIIVEIQQPCTFED